MNSVSTATKSCWRRRVQRRASSWVVSMRRMGRGAYSAGLGYCRAKGAHEPVLAETHVMAALTIWARGAHYLGTGRARAAPTRRASGLRCARAGRGGQGWVRRTAIDPTLRPSYFSAMAKLTILTLPEKILRKISLPIERVDEGVRTLAEDMLETMYAAPGVGLAAVQVGVLRRVIVLDTAKGEDEPPRPLVMINPQIIALGSQMRRHEEGCLSIPDVRIEIERPSSVTVAFLDREGERQELTAEGLLATAIQHEIDHLNGKLIIDFLSRLKRDMVVRKFKKQAKAEVTA